MTDDLPSARDIMDAHDVIEREYDLKYTGTMKPAPEITLRRVVRDAAEHDDPYHRAAALLWNIQRVHVFEDANKRTAWTVAASYLRGKGIEPPPDTDRSERIVTRLGKFDLDEIAHWLETSEIDEDRLPER